MEGTEGKSVRVVRGGFVAALVAAVALPLLMAAPERSPEAGLGRTWSSGGLSGLAERPLATGALPLTVRLTSIVSSASARIGDGWTGIVVRPLTLGPRRVIPAGTVVRGVVTATPDTRPGGRATLELAVQDLTIGGRTRRIAALTGAFIAGARHARYLARFGRGDDEVVLKPRTVMVFALDDRLASR